MPFAAGCMTNLQQRIVTGGRCRLRCCQIAEKRELPSSRKSTCLKDLPRLGAKHEMTNVITGQAMTTQTHPKGTLLYFM
jgi:hypothetical protein